MDIKNITIVGGGALGHVIAGWLSNKGFKVSMLTRRPEDWNKTLIIHTPDGDLKSELSCISNDPSIVVKDSDLVLLTVPGYANRSELEKITPYLKQGCYLGGVFCSSGFFFEALEMVPSQIKLWGFQRVPFICRVEEYGKEANLLGYRSSYNIAVERASMMEKLEFAKWIEHVFEAPTILRNNYLEVTITNSNPLLHTSRLYSMFVHWDESQRYDHNILFYEEWTTEAADILIKMDEELFQLLKYLPVNSGYLTPILEYYESVDAESLKNKLSSISGLKGITSPMKEDEKGWFPDFSNRYFTEDFGYSLRFIWELGQKYGVSMPTIDKVFDWGQKIIESNN